MPLTKSGSPRMKSSDVLVGELLVLLQHVCIISLISSLFCSYLPFVGMVTILMNDYPMLKVSAAVLHAHDPFSRMGQKYREVSSFQRLQVLGVGKGVLFREVSSVQWCSYRERFHYVHNFS